jgi:hypothetical protein
MFFGFATETMEITNFFVEIAYGIHHCIGSMRYFLFVKALRQWRQIREAMKR